MEALTIIGYCLWSRYFYTLCVKRDLVPWTAILATIFTFAGVLL